MPANITSEQAQHHLENLLYMTSILYVDDKKNVKHLKRVNEIIAAMEENFAEEINKEAGGEGQYQGDVYLVARLLTINKILERGINQVKRIIETPASAVRTQIEITAPSADSAKPSLTKLPVGERPKLRETLSFLLSVIDDPALGEKKLPVHLLNLEKIGHLIRAKQQDPKLAKLKESILNVLSKIYGSSNAEVLRLQFNNSLKVFRNMTQYNKLMTELESSVKNFILPSESKSQVADSNEAARRLQAQKQDEEFYRVFKNEKNIFKRIALIQKVLKDATYRYNKELTAACMRVEGGLRLMGLQ